jgi:hypothetical protein
VGATSPPGQALRHALLAAAVLPAGAVLNHVTVAEKGKRLDVPLHDGRGHLGHLSPARSDQLREHLPRDLHVARHLATHPSAPVLFGRALMRRLEQAQATAMATA